jgi:hypothetical protein
VLETYPDGKLPTNQNIDGCEEEEDDEVEVEEEEEEEV